MSKIALLDQSTINKIAAGEVVERPAAVVKELVENAIDAGANGITIEIKEGGISFIRITDNGIGIPKDEVPIAFKRHSTSKIRSAEDLITVSSLGFRGEALASIAAVSQVELLTKTAGAITGSRYLIEGGKEVLGEGIVEEIGCPEGTTFLVRNLFFNTPARRKFLKSAMTEAGYVSDLVERLAISHPNISFKFMNNNQVKLHTSGNGQLKDVIYQVYGRDIAREQLVVEEETELLKLSGFIGKPVISRGNRNYMNYFINGRYIKSQLINRAIEEAYKPYTMSHRYPFTCLNIEMDSQMIDVNVHPTKMEVRFTSQEQIFRTIYDALSLTLRGKELIPEISLKKKEEKKQLKKEDVKKEILKKEPVKAAEPFEVKRLEKEKVLSSLQTPAVSKTEDSSVLKQSVFVKPDVKTEVKADSVKVTSEKTMDSAATETSEASKEKDVLALEKILNPESKKAENLAQNLLKENETAYSQNYSQNISKNVEAAALILPMVQTTEIPKETPKQLELFEEKLLSKENVKEHRIIGQVFHTYWLVEFQDKLFMIDQHAAHEKVLYEKTMDSLKEKEFSSQMLQPPIILTLNLREEEVLKNNMGVFEKLGFEIEHFGGKEYSVYAVPANLYGIAQKELLLEMIDDLVSEDGKHNPDILLEKVASMSCKAAVKGKMKLSVEEAKELIDQLLTLENPYHCPHGRPTIVSMTRYEMEKKFKRII